MTTIVSLAVRDFIVVGCDSLATTSTDLVYPYDITSLYFDSKTGKLKCDADGKPLLQRPGQIWEKAKTLPIDQLPSVTKLYDFQISNLSFPRRVNCATAGLNEKEAVGRTALSRIQT